MTEKAGRNDPCPCGSGKKYKKCCGLPGMKAHTVQILGQSNKESLINKITQIAENNEQKREEFSKRVFNVIDKKLDVHSGKKEEPTKNEEKD